MKSKTSKTSKIRTRSITIDDVRLELRGSGGYGPTVFLLHGNSSSSRSFDGLLEGTLGRRYALWSIDLPGHGASAPSPRPRDHYSIPGLSRLLGDAIAQLAEGPYALVGHSLGGHVLSHALPRLPGAQALVLISAPPLSLGSLPRAYRPDPVDGAIFKGPLSEPEIERLASALLGPAAQDPAHRDVLRAAIRATDPEVRATLGQSVMAGLLHDERAIVATTTVPVALVWGTDDAFIEPGYYDELHAERWLGRGRHAIAGAGHSPHLDHPAAVEGLLTDLLGTAFIDARA